MLKTNVKLWAIVIAICLIGQFFIASVPLWIEQGKQEAQIEIDKREEERLQSHGPGLEPIETHVVETTAPIVEENTQQSDATVDGEEKGYPPIIFIVLFVVVLIAMLFLLFS